MLFIWLLKLSVLINLVFCNKVYYDFIVIGSGPGGSTIANRLSEIKEWKILLLEAGGEQHYLSQIPALYEIFKGSSHDWSYKTQPEKFACFGVINKRCPWPRGKGLGGTTIINNLLYTRGHYRDYDNWELQGNNGWNWESVLKYFKKAEEKLHVNGTYTSKISNSFITSGIELGYPILKINNNIGQLNGFSPTQFTIKNGKRYSANVAYLNPAVRNRQNLFISTNAHVTKILINPITNEAYGVRYLKNGKTIDVYSRKEVILSAGAINTPQKLMLSGIGPEEHLREVNISVIQNLPGVGQNLQDHVESPFVTFTVNDTTAVINNEVFSTFQSGIKYLLSNQGPLSSTYLDGLAYIKTDITSTPLDYPDLELIFAPASIVTDRISLLSKNAGYHNQLYNSIFNSIQDKSTFSIWPALLKPLSKGEIKLKSKNPTSLPLMYANYYENEQDLNIMLDGVKFIITLSQTDALKKYNTQLHTVPVPLCAYLIFASDNYWKCVLKVFTISGHHQCCTAKMGPNTDPMAVVDSELRVYGIKGLRIVDASIMPNNIAGHTMAPTYMIAEKAADMIKLAHTDN